MSDKGMAGYRTWAGLLAAVLMTGSALAQTATAPRRAAVLPDDSRDGMGLGVTAKIGTLGPGVDVTLGLNRYLAVRAVYSQLNLDPLVRTDDQDISFDLNWLNYGGLVDLHVAGGGFRISGGVMANNNDFKATADLNRSVKINDHDYSLDAFNGEMTFAKWAPYVGIGYGAAAGRDGRIHFACDFGVMFQKQPDITLVGTASDPALQAILNDDLAAEVEKRRDDLKWFAFYPVINVGVSVRFF